MFLGRFWGRFILKILNFGSCNIDYVYSLDHIVEKGETETSSKLDIFPGGKGLNQSVAAAKAGAEIYHAGCVGKGGEELINILKENGVDVSYIRMIDEKNGHAIIQLGANGENSIFIYPGSNEKITAEYIDFVLENFKEGDILLLQNEINNIDYIVEQAHKKNMIIILNPSPFNEKLKTINFENLAYIILNEVEAKAISGENDIQKSVQYIKKKYSDLKIVLTLGSDGCIYFDKENELHQPAFSVKVQDTTAAGDTFTGYFAAELLKGTDYENILKIASAASAIAVSRKGAAPSIPCRHEVLSYLKG